MAGELNKKIVLEDGSEYFGEGFGFDCERVCEIVFNTSMAGYQEVFYDPANASQMVLMTYPVIGSIGITEEEQDSRTPLIGAVAVRQLDESVGMCASSLDSMLKENCIPAISGLDTRALARKLRGKGRCFAIITNADTDTACAVEKIKAHKSEGASAGDVSCKTKRYLRTSMRKFNVVVIDCGLRFSYVRLLNKFGCNVTIVPWDTGAQEIMDIKPDGVVVSSGPGDPRDAMVVAETLNALKGKVPVFAMGLGCQLLALSYGAEIEELSTGHRGTNHAVRNLLTGLTETFSQNHGFTLNLDSLKKTDLVLTHVNVVDGSAEGILCEKDKAFGVLYYPENLLESTRQDDMLMRFITTMKEAKKNA